MVFFCESVQKGIKYFRRVRRARKANHLKSCLTALALVGVDEKVAPEARKSVCEFVDENFDGVCVGGIEPCCYFEEQLTEFVRSRDFELEYAEELLDVASAVRALPTSYKEALRETVEEVADAAGVSAEGVQEIAWVLETLSD